MKLIFKNSLGEKILSGTGEGPFGITEISGLGIVPYERQCYTSYDFDGTIESARRIPGRNITIAGDIKGTSRDVKDFLKLMSEPFSMTVEEDGVKRTAYVSMATSKTSRVSENITKFALSLVLDDPYFYDEEETKVALFVREKLLSKKVTSAEITAAR